MTENTPPQIDWVLPPNSEIQPDHLRARMDVYNDSIILTEFGEQQTNWTRMVSAAQMATIFAGEIDYSSGILPPDAIWWKQTESGRAVAVWREPQVWNTALQTEPFKPPQRLKLPMPGLIFIYVQGQAPWVFAAKSRPLRLHDQLYRTPAFNVFANGRICPGNHHFPENPSQIPESFFQSFFSLTGDTNNRSIKHPQNLNTLWQELNGETEYPLDDLVPQHSVEKAIQIPKEPRHLGRPF